ncbi:Holin [Pseudomonas savastanoi pv. glycinea]|nr:Holin [Pseudomonas savastanoi pv. glycinea]
MCRGFFVFGSTTPIAPSWECCWSRIYSSPREGGHRMPNMPDKPDSWAALWVALSNPLWQGAIMAVLISFLRVLYDAKETSKSRIVLEALICGALSLVASSLIEWMEWPPSLSVAAGGSIGFLGVTAIRELVARFIGRKVDSV